MARKSKKHRVEKFSPKLVDDILNDRTKIEYSPHINLYAELIGCDPKKLQDEKFITSTLLSSIFQGRMRLVDYYLKKYEGGGKGLTAVALIAESHIIVNTYPETTLLTLDVYACSGFPLNVLSEFKRRFKPKNVDFTILPRILKGKTIKTRILLNEEDIKDRKLKEWMKKRKLLPLLNTSEKFFLLANFIGFIFGSGYLKKNLEETIIIQKNRYILEVLKEKLEKLRVRSKIVPKGKSRKTFKLVVSDKCFSKLLYLLGAPKDRNLKLPWWIKRDEIPLIGAFISPILVSSISKEKNRLAIIFKVKRENKKFVRAFTNLLKLFKIDIERSQTKKNKRGIEIRVEVKRTSENIFRIQALTSLTKILSLGIFDIPTLIKKEAPLYDSKYVYKIIDYLVEHKRIYESEIAKKLNIPEKEGRKWIKLLNHSNIVKREGRRKGVLVELAVKFNF